MVSVQYPKTVIATFSGIDDDYNNIRRDLAECLRKEFVVDDRTRLFESFIVAAAQIQVEVRFSTFPPNAEARCCDGIVLQHANVYEGRQLMKLNDNLAVVRLLNVIDSFLDDRFSEED